MSNLMRREISAGLESIDAVDSFSTHFQSLWIEVSVMMVAFFLYLWARKGSKSGKESKIRSSTRTRGKGSEDAGATAFDGLVKGDENVQLQNLVTSLMQKGQRSNPAALLHQYEELSKACPNLRHHLQDDQNARSMYLALIGCAAALTPNATSPVAPSQGSALSWSILHRWVAHLLADMWAQGFPRDVDFYAAVLKHFTNGQHFPEALWVHSALIEDGMEPNSHMLISLMNMSISAGDSKKALFFFDGVAKCSMPPIRTVMTILRVHSANKDWQGAVNLLERMEQLGSKPDNLVLNNVLGLCISAGEVDAAEGSLHRWRDAADVISCNILLKGCAQQLDLARGEAVLRGMISNGPPPNIISYNTVMDCIVRCMHLHVAEKPAANRCRSYSTNSSQDGNSTDPPRTSPASEPLSTIVRRPWELLEELTSRGLVPDRYTCSTLVKGMHFAGCSVSDIDNAVKLIYRIGPAALQSPGSGSGALGCNERLLEVLFNTLLDACISVRDLDRMTQIFTSMQEFGVSVSAVTYGTLIKAFGQNGSLRRCHQVWEDMRRANIQPTIVTYGCYIDACLRNADCERAEDVFERMVDPPHAVWPNAVIYTSLIRAFAHTKQQHKALALYRRMRKEGIQPTAVTFNAVLDVAARQTAEPLLMQEVIDDMTQDKVLPNAITYSILTKASCNAGNVQNALAVFRHMYNNGQIFDQVSCNTLLLACSKAGGVKDAEDVFEEMRHVGVTPTPVTTSIMVKMYGRAKMLGKAVAVSELMEEEYAQKPNLHVYTCLIQACVQNRQVRRSWEIFNKMLTSDVAPDAITYGTVIHGCVYLNKLQHAMTIVRHAYMKPQPCTADPDTPFVLTSPLRTAVILQPEVLELLLGALRKKEQATLAAELCDIMAKSKTTAPDSSKLQGGKHSRRTHTVNTDI